MSDFLDDQRPKTWRVSMRLDLLSTMGFRHHDSSIGRKAKFHQPGIPEYQLEIAKMNATMLNGSRTAP